MTPEQLAQGMELALDYHQEYVVQPKDSRRLNRCAKLLHKGGAAEATAAFNACLKD